MDYARARVNMVENQLRPNRIDDPRLIAAMLEIPRERFVPKTYRGVAYADEDLVLPDGRFLIEPLALARLVQTAHPDPDDVVLVVGCTTGYATAVVARLAATVIVVQPEQTAASRIEALMDELGVDNVVVTISDDPLAGHPDEAPFDVILLAGAVEAVPKTLLDQIAEGGRLVAVTETDRVGKGTLFTRLHGVVGRRVMFDAHIPHLRGVDTEPQFSF